MSKREPTAFARDYDARVLRGHAGKRTDILVRGSGRPVGPTLVLLPGPTDSWLSYMPVLERIPRSIRTIAVSQRGHGDADGLVGRDMQDVLEARITDATLVAYPGAGHTPRWEEPQLFADDLATFLSSDELSSTLTHRRPARGSVDPVTVHGFRVDGCRFFWGFSCR